MKEFKGTKGEWKSVFREETKHYAQRYEVQFGYDGECVAEYVNSKEDAQLIAYAPELLETLKKFLELFNEYDMRPEYEMYEYSEEVERVINKALGYV